MIAAVFHWPPSVMDDMEIEEILDWQDRAVATWNAMNRTK